MHGIPLYTSEAFFKDGAPTGMIINSCTSTEESMCIRRLRCSSSEQEVCFRSPHQENRYSGISSASAAALAHAIETARIAFAPRFDLSFVPSAWIMPDPLHKYQMHPSFQRITVDYCIDIFYCLETPFPPNRLFSISKFKCLKFSCGSSAWCCSSCYSSIYKMHFCQINLCLSTVGFPRESMIFLFQLLSQFLDKFYWCLYIICICYYLYSYFFINTPSASQPSPYL